SKRFMIVSSRIMETETSSFVSVSEMLRSLNPREPVYCIYPHIYRQAARSFVNGFPGRVLYAVKANDEAAIIRLLNEAGVAHFDCASVPEIALVRANCPGATCYFMIPVALRGAAHEAFHDYGVRHFMVDDLERIDSLASEIPLDQCVVFARMAVSHESAMMDLSSKFGASPAQIPEILNRIRSTGAEPALAFNVGTLVTAPEAYRHAIEVAAEVLATVDFKLRLIDIGGGFPWSYPGFESPPLQEYFRVVSETLTALPMLESGAIMAEPGRALSAPGLSAVVEVLLRKERRLYLNDGMYGIFWELRFEGHQRFPVRAYRNGERLAGSLVSFKLYGPTCDASDVLPGEVELPEGIQTGDHLEFGNIGAYSLSGRTRFNGHYSERIVEINSCDESPPKTEEA
ncbi:MAG: hypothetical protein OET41_13525, partial [Xanthomonadales bacterium]|nr:hypothetical protein [Xanthomonadales bacterium]